MLGTSNLLDPTRFLYLNDVSYSTCLILLRIDNPKLFRIFNEIQHKLGKLNENFKLDPNLVLG